MKLISVLPDLANPDDPVVAASLAWTCDVCKAAKGVLCVNPIEPAPLPGRVVHYGRLHDRRREAKES